MNNTTISKVTIPSDFMLNFYYWYSYFTLFLTWLITPLLVYVILTQSKNLKSFKWLVLNHSFWCLAFETFYASVKPLILTPAVGGFPLGLLKNGSMKMTMIATFIGVILIANCIAGLLASLLCRYMLVFPSRVTKFLNFKMLIWLTFILAIIIWISLAFGVIPNLSIDEEEIRRSAIEYDPIFLNFVKRESSFQFLPYKVIEIPVLIILIIHIIIFFIFFALIVFFIYSVKSQATTTRMTKLQRSLITSSIIQILCTCIFLVLHPFVLATVIYFQIPYSAGFFCFFCNVIVSHAFIEFIVTLYFVSPYRNFLIKWFRKLLNIKSITRSSNISIVK